jgi:hypothetical protein
MIFGWADDAPVHEVVFEALGAASMCWNPPPEGVFDSTRAEAIGEELMEFLQRKQIGLIS